MTTLKEIQHYADRMAEAFQPERIILFGSHAHGTPGEDSDVDLLVVLPFEGRPWRKAAEIIGRVRPPFPLDLIARTPEKLRERCEMRDGFMLDIVEKGKILHESHRKRMGAESRGGFRRHGAGVADKRRRTGLMKHNLGLSLGCLALLLASCSKTENAAPPAGQTASAPKTEPAKPAADTTPSESDPKAIIDATVANYAKMKSYQAEGNSVTTMGESGGGMKIETTFSIKLGRPHLYQIAWKGMMNQTGATWNSGDGPFYYMGMPGMPSSYSKMASDQMALASATGVSAGAANTIPSLFFASPTSGAGMLGLMTDLKIEKMESLDGEECYVIAGQSAASVKDTVWISKSRRLLLRHEYSLERPSGAPDIPEMNDEMLDKTIRSMGKTPSAEERKNMRDMMESARKMTKNLKGTSSETHSKVVIDAEIPKDAFAYKLPDGAQLKDSIF